MSKRDPVPSVWCGADVWRCPFCAYDSDQEAKTLAHIDAAHPLPPPIVKPGKEVTNA